MNKKIPALLICVLMLVSALAACGREVLPTQEAVTTAAATTKAATTDAAATTTEAATESWTPTAEDFSKYYENNGFIKGVTALDYVTIPDFATYEIDEDSLKTADEDIDSVINSFLQTYLYEENYDKVIEDGDTVCIAYTGYVDGKTFDGGATGDTGTVVTIGTTNYIDDFLEQLIGHKPGDDLSIEVTFPTDYGKDELNGKDAVFETTILYVETVPELTEQLMTDNAAYFAYYFNTEVSTPEELRQTIYDTYYSYNLTTQVTKLIEADIEDMEVPQAAYDCALNMTTISIAEYSMDLETYKSTYGYSDEEFEALVTKDAKVLLLYQAIAEREGWDVTEDEIKTFAGDSFDSYKEQMGIGYLAEYVIYTKAASYILDNVTIK